MGRNADRILLALAVALWLPAACIANSPVLSLCPTCPPNAEKDYSDSVLTGTNAPSATPHGMSDTSGSYTDRNTDSSDGIDFLVAAFFLIAAGWLVLAIIYSILVLLVVRLRARGQLDVYDETFGRFYLFGTRCYIPLGCVLRRYVIAMNQERDRQGDPVAVRIMSRDERRTAMELLLAAQEVGGPKRDASHSNRADTDNDLACPNDSKVPGANGADQNPAMTADDENVADDATTEEPVCTICLGEYETSDVCFTSTVCSHRYHRACIMEWLERRANTECPCCRTPLVSDEEVWTTVQNLRQVRRRQIRKANRGRGFFSRFGRRQSSSSRHEETFEATSPPSPLSLSPATTGVRDSDEEGDSVHGENSLTARPATPDLEVGSTR